MIVSGMLPYQAHLVPTCSYTRDPHHIDLESCMGLRGMSKTSAPRQVLNWRGGALLTGINSLQGIIWYSGEVQLCRTGLHYRYHCRLNSDCHP